MGCLIVILTLVVVYGISFLLTAGIFSVICWAFSWTFSWKIAVGVWLVLCLVSNLFKVHMHND